MKTFVLGLAAASLFALSTLGATPSVVISNSFAIDPAQQGWKTFGNSNLFNWNSTNGCLDVTWDSSKSNSYFYHPIGTVLTRKDDFAMEFDLTIHDLVGSFELAFGFLNLGDATGPGFLRGTGSGATNLVEVDYFPPNDPWGGGIAPTFFATNRWNKTYNSGLSSGWFPTTLPVGTPIHVSLTYTGLTSTVFTTVSADGSTNVYAPFTLETSFTDFRCDAFAIESYSDTGAYGGRVFAHGSVRNVKLTVPPVKIKGQLQPTGWTVTFDSLVDWNYALERSSDLMTWTNVPATIYRTGAACTLQDSDAATGARYYRVRAQGPN